MTEKYLIVGDGIAGATAAETVREKDEEADIKVFTDESEPLYNRITLKSFMKGKVPKKVTRIHNRAWYSSRNIDLELETRIVDVNTEEKTAKTDSGEKYSYDKLLVATGGSPKRLEAEEGFENIYYMWDMEDAEEIKEDAESCEKAVVIGAGLLGIDLAVIYAEHGSEVDYVMRGNRWWRKGLDEKGAEIVHRKLEQKGVNLVKNTEIDGFETENNNVKAVVSEEGERFECDSVGAAIGQTPNSDFLDVEKNGEGKIKTDRFLQTSDPDIYAAGNMVEFYHPVYGRRLEKGSWDNSEEMGRTAAKNMLGEKKEYSYINTYGVGHFDIPFLAIGDWNGNAVSEDYDGEDRYKRLFFKDNRLVGAVMIGNTKEKRELKHTIREGKAVKDSENILRDK